MLTIRNKDPKKIASLARRFLAKVEPCQQTDCWYWTGAQTRSGGRDHGSRKPYGHMKASVLGLSVMRAHRIAWVLFRGPLDPDLEVDHTCRNSLCVNPYHLEALDPAEHHATSMHERWAKPNGRALAPVEGRDWNDAADAEAAEVW